LNDPELKVLLLGREPDAVRSHSAMRASVFAREKLIKAQIEKARAAEVTDTAGTGTHAPRLASDDPEPGPDRHPRGLLPLDIP
jgi:hypothetical protein